MLTTIETANSTSSEPNKPRIGWHTNKPRRIAYKFNHRAKKHSNGNGVSRINPQVIRLFFANWPPTCLACGTQEDVTIDHVVPLIRGGRNKYKNLQPLCVRCNMRKGEQVLDYRPVYWQTLKVSE